MLPARFPQTSQKIGGRYAAPRGASKPEPFAASLKRCQDTKPSLSAALLFSAFDATRFSTACLGIGLLAAMMGCYSGNHPARIGSNAPDFTLQDSDHTVTLSQFRGQVVVLNFWATWCPPCIEETPS